jgi:hypothetical protein
MVRLLHRLLQLMQCLYVQPFLPLVSLVCTQILGTAACVRMSSV